MNIQNILWGLMYLSVLISSNSYAEGRVPTPNPPPAKAPFSEEQKCVEPIEVIRRFHGDFLKHQRDDTMYRGMRTRKYSLVNCINCHVSADASGQLPSIDTQEHFCQSCHHYAAVTIDCFQCHASQPGAVPGLEPVTTSESPPDSVDSN